MSPRRTGLLAGGTIAAAVAAAYGNSYSGPFVFDDGPSIADNPSIRHLWPLAAVLHPSLSAGVGGRPLLNLTYALNYAVSGPAVWSYHALNLLIHLLAALTLLGIVRRTLSGPLLRGRFGAASAPLAFASALIWALHPVQTASVTYLSERAESLMGLLYLATLYCFIRSVEVRPRFAWQAGAVLACALGLATKEVMVTAPVMVLLYDRVFVAGSWAGVWRTRKGLHGALAGTWLLLAEWTRGLGTRGAGYGLGYTAMSYARTECWVVVHYLSLTLWPHPLVFDHGVSPASGPMAVWAAVLSGVLILTAIALICRPCLGYAGAWFFVILAPTSSVVPLAYQPMAENRLYLPLAAVVVLAVIGLHTALGRGKWILLAAAAAACAVATARRNDDYRSEIDLWRDTARKCPANAGAHNNLGCALMRTPDGQAGAIAEFKAALRIDPGYVEAHNNLGIALASVPNRRTEAIAEYREALRLRPDYAEAHYNLGNALAGAPGDRMDAVAQYQAALRCQPDYPRAYNNLGNVLLEIPGRTTDAIDAFREALRLDPGYARAHLNLAAVLLRFPDRRAEAVAEYRVALRLQPGDVRGHNNLGTLLLQDGRTDEGIAEYRTAVRLDPDAVDPRFNLGSALAQTGRIAEAISQYREILRLQPGNEEARADLAQLEAPHP